MRVNIDEFKRLLEDYIDPYEIPGAMQAFIEAAEETESYDIWKEKHNDTQVSIGKDITGR